MTKKIIKSDISITLDVVSMIPGKVGYSFVPMIAGFDSRLHLVSSPSLLP